MRWFEYAAVPLLFAALAALAQAGFVESGGWQISWDDSRGAAQRTADPSAEVVLYEQPEPSGDCDYNELRGRVLSIVGSLVSFETNSGWYCHGTAHDGAVARFATVDLETGDAVDIRSLVPETAILAALKRDLLVNRALDGRDPEELRSLIGQADGGCAVSFLSLATSFAFYEIRGGKAVVRFGLGHGCEVMRGLLNEIEIELPLPAGLDVAEADAKGHLMNSLAPGPVRRFLVE